ncbi:hypothetical protein [Mycoplasma sp. Z1473D]
MEQDKDKKIETDVVETEFQDEEIIDDENEVVTLVEETSQENPIVRNHSRDKSGFKEKISSFFDPKNKKAQILVFSALAIVLVLIASIITISILGII